MWTDECNFSEGADGGEHHRCREQCGQKHGVTTVNACPKNSKEADVAAAWTLGEKGRKGEREGGRKRIVKANGAKC